MYTENTAQVKRDDEMSSMKISPGCCVILFKNANYGGKMRKVCKSVIHTELDEFQDNVSSMKLEFVGVQGKMHE